MGKALPKTGKGSYVRLCVWVRIYRATNAIFTVFFAGCTFIVE